MRRFGFKSRCILALSYLSLLWERLWRCLWPAASLAVFFCTLALLNIPQLFGPAWHLALLSIFGLAFAATLARAARGFSLPSVRDTEMRVEKISALSHRPLETLHDAPVEGLSRGALALWQKHLQKTAARLSDLKIYTPQPDISSRDRWALRHAAIILFAVGLVVAQGESLSRLHRAVTPDIGVFLQQKTATIDLWITPPEYTREAPVFLATAKQGLVARTETPTVPKGSTLKLRLAGYRFTPHLHYAGHSYSPAEAAPGNFTFEMPLLENGTLKLGRWFDILGEWPIDVAEDTAPDISITQLGATPRAAVKIDYQAQDDHGIVKMTGIVTLQPEGQTYSFNIQPPSANGKAVHVEDMTAHPWAGSPVTLTLEAEDAAGHKSISTPANTVLPERTFNNPIAQRLIAERKSLLRDAAPANRRVVAGNIAAIAGDPNLYKGNIGTFLTLGTAARRLLLDNSAEAAETAQDILWQVALKLEDGGLSLAQRELHDALQKMTAALNDKNLSKQQLQDIMDDVRQKMQQYVQSLAAEMQQRLQQGKNTPVLSPDLAQKFMKNIDLGQMLEQMRQLMQGNSRENLQKMAENLKNMIDNIDMGKFDQMREKQMQAMEALQNLDDIIRRQQALYDKTNKSDDPADTKEAKTVQAEIRRQLGDSLRTLEELTGGIPGNFAEADQAMKRSETALGKKMPQESLPQQKAALDALQKGLDDLIQQTAGSMQQSILSFGLGANIGNMGEGYDPLGRQQGSLSGDEVKVPTEKQQRRVQEIIEELRNRSSEPNRTKVERDYIDRLLDQF